MKIEQAAKELNKVFSQYHWCESVSVFTHNGIPSLLVGIYSADKDTKDQAEFDIPPILHSLDGAVFNADGTIMYNGYHMAARYHQKPAPFKFTSYYHPKFGALIATKRVEDEVNRILAMGSQEIMANVETVQEKADFNLWFKENGECIAYASATSYRIVQLKKEGAFDPSWWYNLWDFVTDWYIGIKIGKALDKIDNEEH